MNLAGIGMAVLLLPLFFLTTSSNQIQANTSVLPQPVNQLVANYTDIESLVALVLEVTVDEGPNNFLSLEDIEEALRKAKEALEEVGGKIVNESEKVVKEVEKVVNEVGKVVNEAGKIVNEVVKVVVGAYDEAKKVFGTIVDALEDVVNVVINTGDTVVTLAIGVVKDVEKAVVTIGGETLPQIIRAVEDSAMFKSFVTALSEPNFENIKGFLITTGKFINDHVNVTCQIGKQFLLLSYNAVRKFAIDAYEKPLKFLLSHAIIPLITGAIYAATGTGTFFLLPILATPVLTSIIMLFIKGLIDHILIHYDADLYEKLKCYASQPFIGAILATLEMVVGMFLSSSIKSGLTPNAPVAPVEKLDVKNPSALRKWATENGKKILEKAKKMVPDLSERTIKAVAVGVYTFALYVIRLKFIPGPNTDPCKTIEKLTNNTGNLTEEYAADVIEASVSYEWPKNNSE